MAHNNKEVIEGAYKSFSAGDIGALMEIWTDDVEWHIAGDHPLAGDHKGKEAVAAFLGGLVQQTGGTLQVELQNVMADDEQGYSLHKSTATRDGEDFESWEILGYRFDDGDVAEIWSFAYDQSITNALLA